MRHLLGTFIVGVGVACATTPSTVSTSGDYVANIPRDCPGSDISVFVVNPTRNPMEVFWVVGRRPAKAGAPSYRIGRVPPGRSKIRVEDNIRKLILGNVEGHWSIGGGDPSGRRSENWHGIGLICTP